MGDDVHEEAPLGREPRPQARHQLAPVHDLLEHLDRDDAVELAVGREYVHVRGDHAQVRQAAQPRLLLDIGAPALRIRDRRDLGVRKLPRHPQRQRAPAAAELKDGLTVGKTGMLDGLAQRLLLGLLQGGRIGLVEAGRVFEVGAEHLREKGRGHLVMPGIRLADDRPQHHPPGEGGIIRGTQRGQARRRARAQALDRGADHDIRQRHAFGRPDDRGHDAHAATPLVGSRPGRGGKIGRVRRLKPSRLRPTR